jgi:hypothetical protein
MGRWWRRADRAAELTAVRDQLNDQCENGGVTGVVARTYTILEVVAWRVGDRTLEITLAEVFRGV